MHNKKTECLYINPNYLRQKIKDNNYNDYIKDIQTRDNNLIDKDKETS